MPAGVPEDGGNRRFILRQVVQTIRCGSCGALYRAEDLTILESTDNVWMLMAVCPGCETQVMVMVVVKEDLVEAEADPLDSDDVLDFHTILLSHEGDVRTLLGDDD